MAHFWSRWIGREQTSRPQKRKRDSLRRRPRPENLESRQLLAANIFHNETAPEDVDEDGIISTLDALTVMNQIRRQSANGLGRDGGGEQRGRGRMTDVNNDGLDSPLDALMVMNRFRRSSGGTNGPIDGTGDQVDTPADDTTDDTTDDSTEIEADDDTPPTSET